MLTRRVWSQMRGSLVFRGVRADCRGEITRGLQGA
ncbi:hypothetical protein KPB2_5503 [Klebsiella pneumoniae Kb677]|nr:hypothetical protein KPB2_5503 [Klebsiella pneumoniae Kb677]